jgi:C4-dicarboxylate-specific signal transduction histidine kinase
MAKSAIRGASAAPGFFDPFFTAKPVDRGAGSVYPSVTHIRNHGGSIDVQSVYGQGTTFAVRLPLFSHLGPFVTTRNYRVI